MRKSSLLLLVALTGCASFNLDNRVACTAGHDKAFVVSQYGSVGIASTLSEFDRPTICGIPAGAAK